MTPQKAPASALADAERAQIHQQLAALERAGVPLMQALNLVQLPGAAGQRLARTREGLSRGLNLADAGARAGLYTPMEAVVLRAAISAGSPALTLERLGAMAAARARRSGQMRARLAMPLFVLAVGLFVQPLPALVSGAIGGGSYLAQTIGPLLALAAAITLLRAAMARHAAGQGGPARALIESILLQLPLFGELLIRTQAQRFVDHLGLLLGSGVAMFEALPMATDTLSVAEIRNDYAQLLPRMQAGASLSTAAAALRYPGSRQLLGMISSGEGSGKLPELLERHARSEADWINGQQQQLATWLPRLVYAMLLIWLAYGAIGGFQALIHRPIE